MYLRDDPTASRSMSGDERLDEIARILRSAFMDTSVAFGEFRIRSRNRATEWLTEHARPRGPGGRHEQSPFGINRPSP